MRRVFARVRSNGVVPVWTDRMPFDVECFHLGLRHGATGFVATFVEEGFDSQAGGGLRTANEGQHGLPIQERLARPVETDRAKEAMLDWVPLGTAGGIMTHRHGQTQTVTQLVLNLLLPQTRAVSIRAAAIGQDQQLLAWRIRQTP